MQTSCATANKKIAEKKMRKKMRSFPQASKLWQG